jgi:hypothetical protein
MNERCPSMLPDFYRPEGCWVQSKLNYSIKFEFCR